LEAAGAGALLFAVHPIHVESVANVIGRKELLVTAFLLLMVLAHSRARRTSPASLLLAPLAFVCAMFSKEIGVVGLGLVALNDLVLREPQEEIRRRDMRTGALYVSYGLTLAGYLAVRATVVGDGPAMPVLEIDNPAASATVFVRWVTAVAVVGKGLMLQLAPIGQSPDYSYAALTLARTPLDPRFLGAILIAGGWVFAGLRSRVVAPAVLLGAGWYALCLLPASNLPFAIGTIFGERLLYAPSVGFALTGGWLLASLASRSSRSVLLLAATGLCVVLAGATVRYSAVWKSNFELFSHARRVVPNSARVHHKLAEEFFRRRDFANAEQSLLTSLEIWPKGHQSLGLLADLYYDTGRAEEAANMYHRTLEIDPKNAGALYGLGRIQRDAGDLAAAEGFWLRALRSNPRHVSALSDMGSSLYLRGDRDAAIRYWDLAVLHDPTRATAWYNLGLAYREAGDAQASTQAFREFLRHAGTEYSETVQEVMRLLGDEPNSN
jgi:tetratricopeptide (TPR) repeat protein